MHDDHDHHDHAHPHAHSHGPGHNRPKAETLQWQTPHLPHGHSHGQAAEDPRKTDLDLVEAAFVEAFSRAPDPVSLLRVAAVPFVGEDGSVRRVHLLRVETEDVVDVGAVAPLLGGGGVRYDPLPAKMTSRRRRLVFLYHDGQTVRRLGLAAAKELADRTEASAIETRTA